MTARPDLQMIHDYLRMARADILDNVETLVWLRNLFEFGSVEQIAVDGVILNMLTATLSLKHRAGDLSYLGALAP